MEEIICKTVDELLDEMNKLDARKLELQALENKLYAPLIEVRSELKMIETKLGILKRDYWRARG